jgi:lysozyme
MNVQIEAPVGVSGRNLVSDVKVVQGLLNRCVTLLGLHEPLRLDGRFGPKTMNAIREFQRQVMHHVNPDVRVDPGGKTLKALCAVKVIENPNAHHVSVPLSDFLAVSLPANLRTLGRMIFPCPEFPRRASRYGKALIRKHEGLKRILYNCPAGHATIGIGHKVHSGPIDGSEPDEFKKGISESRAWQLFAEDLLRFERAVCKGVKVAISQEQFDALISWAFNFGDAYFTRTHDIPTFLKLLNKCDYVSVPSELRRWNKAVINGKRREVDGLIARRHDEATLFETGCYPADIHQFIPVE